MSIEFSDMEFMQLFVDFSKEFDQNLDFQYDIKEMVELFEYFAEDKSFGVHKLETLFHHSGIACTAGEYQTMEGSNQPLHFDKLVYKKIYDSLCDAK